MTSPHFQPAGVLSLSLLFPGAGGAPEGSGTVYVLQQDHNSAVGAPVNRAPRPRPRPAEDSAPSARAPAPGAHARS